MLHLQILITQTGHKAKGTSKNLRRDGKYLSIMCVHQTPKTVLKIASKL